MSNQQSNGRGTALLRALIQLGSWRPGGPGSEEAVPLGRQAVETLARLESEVAQLRAQIDAMQAQLNPPAPKPAKPQSAPAFIPGPSWLERWRESRSFANDSQVVLVLGETGECRRALIAREVASRRGIKPISGGIKRAFDRLAGKGLIEVVPINPQASGRPSDLVRLTPSGRDAYRLLAHRAPRPSLFDVLMIRCESPEHAYLILEAADLLQEVGYDVDRFSPTIALPDGETFTPDLEAVSPEGETLRIKVERKLKKSVRHRGREWGLYYTATGGQFSIITANRTEMRAIQSEILLWINNCPLRLWMANISDMRLDQNDGIWLIQKKH